MILWWGVTVSKNCPPPKFIGPTVNSKYNKKFWNLPSDEALNRAVHSHSPVWKMFLTEKNTFVYSSKSYFPRLQQPGGQMTHLNGTRFYVPCQPGLCISTPPPPMGLPAPTQLCRVLLPQLSDCPLLLSILAPGPPAHVLISPPVSCGPHT